MKKLLSVIFVILMIVTTIPFVSVAEDEEPAFKEKHTVTIKFDSTAYRETDGYSGPGFDGRGMGFTLRYHYKNNRDYPKYISVDLFKADSYQDGDFGRIDITCEGLPFGIEYYCRGDLDKANNKWALRSVLIEGQEIWSGNVEANAKGINPFIATVDFYDGSIKVNDESPIAGGWLNKRTDSYTKVDFCHITSAYVVAEGGNEWNIRKHTYEKKVDIIFVDQYGVKMYDEGFWYISGYVTARCFHSSEGISIIRKVPGYSGDIYPEYTDDTTIKVYFSDTGPHFYIRTEPSAISEEWLDQTLTFTVEYIYNPTADNRYTESGTIDVKGRIVLNNPEISFTLDATYGSFEDGQTVTINKLYPLKVGALPVPVKKGYTFNGFYLTQDENYDDNITPDSEKLTEDTVMKENQTWYASWTRNTYGVTYSYLDESGNRVAVEHFYKYGEEYTAPEVPYSVVKNDTLFLFSHWDPEFTGTKIMSDSNELYKAVYLSDFIYADYSDIDEAVAEAEKVKSSENYSLKYTEESREALDEALKLEGLRYDLRSSDQHIVDAYAKNIIDAIESLSKVKFTVLFVGEEENVIASSEVSYGEAAAVPQVASIYIDSNKHFEFIGWNESTDACEFVTDNMKFTAIYSEGEHTFTYYVIDKIEQGGKITMVSYCDGDCGATDTLHVVSSCSEHKDTDNNGICDNCLEVITPDEPDTPDVPDIPDEPDEPDTPDEPDVPADDGICDECGKVHTNFFSEIFCFFAKIINFIKNIFA